MHRGRQQYRCHACGYQFINQQRKKRWVKQAFARYCQGKQTIVEISQAFNKSISTVQRHFDQVIVEPIIPVVPIHPINLLVDATFFSRSDGVLIFRANKKNVYWRFVSSESIAEIKTGLMVLEQHGYQFSSVTLDGRRGVIQLFLQRYPQLPIQLCQFHQIQIIRRYTTNNPQTECGRQLKTLMQELTCTQPEDFMHLFDSFCEQYDEFLKERNEQGTFVHRRLRSARRSLKANLPFLFTFKHYSHLNTPNTTNSCDGSFAHWKQKVKIHRGLRKDRRNKVINFLLNNTEKP